MVEKEREREKKEGEAQGCMEPLTQQGPEVNPCIVSELVVAAVHTGISLTHSHMHTHKYAHSSN